MMPSLTPYDLPFPKIGVPYAPRYANDHISATGDPIHVMFGSRVGFSGSADRMTLGYFWLHQIQVGGRPPSRIISNGHISATAHSIHLCIAHRAVIFAIAQLSCRSRLLVSLTYSSAGNQKRSGVEQMGVKLLMPTVNIRLQVTSCARPG